MDADKQRMKWRPGACENCGARGHRRKECFEKPRKVPAKFAKEPIAIPAEQPEEPIRREQLVDGGGSGTASYDAKRDRWSCYDPSDYREVEEEFEKMEEARRKLKAEQVRLGGWLDCQQGLLKAVAGFQGEVVELVDTNDEDVYAEDMAPVQGVDMDSRTRITVRNLRIREDTAKYLFNLDPQGAYYDPKSRSMRENPFKVGHWELVAPDLFNLFAASSERHRAEVGDEAGGPAGPRREEDARLHVPRRELHAHDRRGGGCH
jgi:pre-mRNA-processing factor SLU7